MEVITLVDLKNICYQFLRVRKTISRVRYAFGSFIDKMIKLLQCNKILFIKEGYKKYRWQNFSKTSTTKPSLEKEHFNKVYGEIIYNVIPYLKEKYSNVCDIDIYQNIKCEADDVIGMLTLYYSNINTSKIYIISNDKDFYQLINATVTVLSLDNKLSLTSTVHESINWKQEFEQALENNIHNKQFVKLPNKRKKISILCDPILYPEDVWVEILTYIYNIFLIVPVEPTVRAITKLSGYV